ncbi:helix-turn-helix domain-containing protein [Hyphomonas sp.]|uniref:helix-turn-helix domain-containing protein n=1 Tax=Hyphomonas sp. TaxID=87 RepID=UPI0035695012
MPTPTTPPSAVRRTLRKLGQDMADARKRRGLTMKTVADRAFTTRKTLARVEDGDHGVSIGIYASVLNALGLLDGLGDLADPANDAVGLSLSSADLPKRVRAKRS